MAVKLPAIERAKIRLGDFDYSHEMLLKVTDEIEAEDAAAENGQPVASSAPVDEKILEAAAEKPKRGRGRPRKVNAGRVVSIWLDGSMDSQLYFYAKEHGVSVSEAVRKILECHLK